MSNRIKLKSSKKNLSSNADKDSSKGENESKFTKAKEKDNKGKISKTSSANKTQKDFSTKKKLSK